MKICSIFLAGKVSITILQLLMKWEGEEIEARLIQWAGIEFAYLTESFNLV